MTILEQFNQRVIEILHGDSSDNAVIKEYDDGFNYIDKNGEQYSTTCKTVEEHREIFGDPYNGSGVIDHVLCPNVTIGRVFKALSIIADNRDCPETPLFISISKNKIEIDDEIYWKLTKEDGFTEATSEDQKEEDLENILSLLP